MVPESFSPLPPSSIGVSDRMRRARGTDTAPELALRRALHRGGLRYRIQYRPPGLPRRTVDVAFTQAKLAILVDGCFWHACPEHASWPGHNGDWWRAKLEANVARDRDTDRQLGTLGWTVLRLWEHLSTEEMEASVRHALDEIRHSTCLRALA